MQFELTHIEVVIIFGLLVVLLGPERVAGFGRDLLKLWNDCRAVFRRRKA